MYYTHIQAEGHSEELIDLNRNFEWPHAAYLLIVNV